VLTQDYDGKMGDTKAMYKAVVFNPVPGPPMGAKTKLSFRYWLKGTDTLRVQIFSLSKGYHRYLAISGLPQGVWRHVAVDMTAARRPDGSGGPLAKDERIDDIQFYIDPRADLIIDDIVLYEPSSDGEKRSFPKRMIYTAWFDTGKQGKEWPGDFKIVLHKKPLAWDAAQSVSHPKTGQAWIRIDMRGRRPLGKLNRMRFKYHLAGADKIDLELFDRKTGKRWKVSATGLTGDKWSQVSVDFKIDQQVFADEIRMLVPLGAPSGAPLGAKLLVDDLLLYEPGG